ncbi:AB hydrolase-1 domain-containing protein [Citrus sinensis]|uniref:AB hydrolase-1 domain-containing protein n=1 Tax=Citrus sinensis TaxID=2711 RepID=A0ACB8I922_CITSI|nr:AB hydrolase-1 domain-containing protein [Citrus sinensis]
MHVAEKGQGPEILFLYVFPELRYSWCHQTIALASLSYRAVAPDLSGFGDTDELLEMTSYTANRIKALVNLSVVFNPNTSVSNSNWIKALRAYTEIVIKEFLTLWTPDPIILPKGKGYGQPPDAIIALPGTKNFMHRGGGLI